MSDMTEYEYMKLFYCFQCAKYVTGDKKKGCELLGHAISLYKGPPVKKGQEEKKKEIKPSFVDVAETYEEEPPF